MMMPTDTEDEVNVLEGYWRKASSQKLPGAVTVALMLLAVMSLFTDNQFAKVYNSSFQASETRHLRISQGENHTLLKPVDEEQKLPPIHVLFGLSGDHPGFFGEFKVALKSILLNAPHHQDMNIHIMADQKAYDYLPTVWNETELDGAEWWRNITIIPYNVEPHIPLWTDIVQKSTKSNAKPSHTFGAYFRLFAQKVLPRDVGYALYIDTDVAFLSNLNNLFQYAPKTALDTSSPLFLTANNCDGFMLMNVAKLETFWAGVSSIEWTEKMLKHGDQSLVFGVGKKYAGSVAILPEPWDLTISDHWREAKTKEKITKFRPELGYVHFNGGGASKGAYWETDFFQKRADHVGLPGAFYRDLPWTWARFMGKSPGGLDNTGVRIQGSSNSTFIHRIPANTTLGFHTADAS